SFVTSHIPSLQNQDKYGLLIGNCCSSSEFAGTCFAEEILRAENKGAVGYIGGSNSTYWDEDYYFGVGYGAVSENPPPYEETGLGNYDRSFHDHGEEFGEWFTAMDQVVYAGNFAVSESGSGQQTYYWDIYNLMGDPSLMIYYGVPEVMPVTHNSVIVFGQTTTSVDAVPYAYISITMDNVIHGVALADENGHADIDLEAFPAPGEAEIVVTAQNYQPYIASIDIIQDGVYAQFEADNIQICAGNSVNFTDQSFGNNTSWEWVFEGGTPGTYGGQTPPPIVYANPGTFNVILTVSDGTDTDAETKTDYITVLENVTVDFDADVTFGTSPLTVNFIDLSSNNVTSWEWDFGNGGSSGIQNPTYTYYQSGTFIVSLTVEGNGCENTETKIDFIVVEASAPLVDFIAEPISGVLPLTVNFSDESEGEIDTWLWDFGDG
ncbi:MAG: PKD domain-containing protein, partial [Bacteroidales bacterium]|nr:PKD domain-containing protein [Bacteroidales bacterium]